MPRCTDYSVILLSGKGEKRKQEIRNGFRLAGNLLLGFITMVLLLLGALALTGHDMGRVGRGVGYLAFAAGITIVHLTAERWKTYIAGFFGLPGLWNGCIVLSSGHTLAWPYKPVLLVDRLFEIGFCIALILLTYPSSKWRKPFDGLSHLCFVGAVIAFFFAWVNQETTMSRY